MYVSRTDLTVQGRVNVVVLVVLWVPLQVIFGILRESVDLILFLLSHSPPLFHPPANVKNRSKEIKTSALQEVSSKKVEQYSYVLIFFVPPENIFSIFFASGF